MMPYIPQDDPIEESKHGVDLPIKKLPLDPKYNPFEPSQPEFKAIFCCC